MYLVPHIAQTLEQSQNPAIIAAVQQLISSAVCHSSKSSSLIKATYVNGKAKTTTAIHIFSTVKIFLYGYF